MLIDTVKQNPRSWFRKEFIEGLDEVKPVNVDLQFVADYHFTLGSPVVSSASDFPNIAPPWDNAWYEFKIPGTDKSFGCLQSGGRTYAEGYEDFYNDIGKIFGNVELGEIVPSYMTYSSLFCFSRSEQTFYPDIYMLQVLDADGRAIHNGKGTAVLRLGEGWDKLNQVGFGLDLPKVMYSLYLVVMFGISLIHCKNTKLVKNKIDPKEQQRRIRRNLSPITRYYTLDITPMNKIVTSAMRESGGNFANALHICRGHFKDYSKGGGLFGRNKGLYWWNQQARGTKAAGEVVKDYSVSVGNEQGSKA